jgi:hypothetical protein
MPTKITSALAVRINSFSRMPPIGSDAYEDHTRSAATIPPRVRVRGNRTRAPRCFEQQLWVTSEAAMPARRTSAKTINNRQIVR